MKTSVKVALFAVFFIALGCIFAALYLFNTNHRDLSRVKPDFVITSTDLVNELEKDEASATAKYMNKIVEVTGPVHFLKIEDKKVTSITLQTGNATSLVICNFHAGIDPEKFDVDIPSTIRGVFSGFLMDVMMNNCSFIK
ncbi:MAG: OB-fold putative lipoprotein [Bacteroidales bacterium]|nr:OB-fold putative lipoprotein [Bacteroidales bacterium]